MGWHYGVFYKNKQHCIEIRIAMLKNESVKQNGNGTIAATLKSICVSNRVLIPWCKEGIKAIKNEHRNKIKVPDTKLLGGSVDFDKALEKDYSQENRWDYGFDYDGNFIFIEFHPAQTSEIECMINKVDFISHWLQNNCPDILKLPKFEKGKRQYYWVATGRNGILPSSRDARRLAIKNIKPVGSVFNYAKLKNEW